jgi:hypothetical protein
MVGTVVTSRSSCHKYWIKYRGVVTMFIRTCIRAYLLAKQQYKNKEITKAEYIMIIRNLITATKCLNGYKKYEH